MEKEFNWGLSVEHLPCTRHTGYCENLGSPNKDDIKWYGWNIQIIRARVVIVLYIKIMDLLIPYVFLRVLMESFMNAPE